MRRIVVFFGVLRRGVSYSFIIVFTLLTVEPSTRKFLVSFPGAYIFYSFTIVLTLLCVESSTRNSFFFPRIVGRKMRFISTSVPCLKDSPGGLIRCQVGTALRVRWHTLHTT